MLLLVRDVRAVRFMHQCHHGRPRCGGLLTGVRSRSNVVTWVIEPVNDGLAVPRPVGFETGMEE